MFLFPLRFASQQGWRGRDLLADRGTNPFIGLSLLLIELTNRMISNGEKQPQFPSMIPSNGKEIFPICFLHFQRNSLHRSLFFSHHVENLREKIDWENE